jgi:hypothetical protein
MSTRTASRVVRLALSLALLVGLAMGLSKGVAYAAGGDLDLTFGEDGRVTTDDRRTHDEARAVAVQPDGKIVAAGMAYRYAQNNYDIGLARYEQ